MLIVSLCLFSIRPQHACDVCHDSLVDYLPAQALCESGRNLTPSASIFSWECDSKHLNDGSTRVDPFPGYELPTSRAGGHALTRARTYAPQRMPARCILRFHSRRFILSLLSTSQRTPTAKASKTTTKTAVPSDFPFPRQSPGAFLPARLTYLLPSLQWWRTSFVSASHVLWAAVRPTQ